MDTFGVIVCILILAIGVFLSVGRSSRSGSVTRQPRQEMREQPRETFTNEEILLPGVDIRRPNARKLIETSRKAQALGITPGHLIDRYQRELTRRNANPLREPDDVIDGEVTDAEPRRLLRGR